MFKNQQMKVNYLVIFLFKKKLIRSILPLDLVQPLAEMKTPIKVIDDYMQFINEGFNNYLLDQTDFLVIGCLGLQGVGKSTLMSDIAHK